MIFNLFVILSASFQHYNYIYGLLGHEHHFDLVHSVYYSILYLTKSLESI